MKIIIQDFLILLICVILVLDINAQSGKTPGELSVTPSGAAVYEMDLVLSPGTAGLMPNISLLINSQGQVDGLAGNVEVAGVFQSISRIPQTKDIDGRNLPIDFTAQDRFALNGNRLILNSGGYGETDSQYRPEHSPYTKVQSFGGSNGSPAYFVVETQDGLTLEFGRTPDSRVELVGSSVPLQWLLNRVTDRSDNYYTLHYEEQQGVAYPSYIAYTGNEEAGLLPYNKIRFNYSSETPKISYVGGKQMVANRRLKSIESLQGSALCREYKLKYVETLYQARGVLDPLAFDSGSRSFLSELIECGSDGACLNSTTFEGNIDFKNEYKESKNPVGFLLSDDVELKHIHPADINNDAITDLIVVYKYKPSGVIYRAVILANEDFETQSSCILDDLHDRCSQFGTRLSNDEPFVKEVYRYAIPEEEFSDEVTHHSGDFNGDNREDILVVTKDYIRILINDGREYESPSIHLSTFYTARLDEIDLSKAHATVGDFNGDGRSDVLLQRKDKNAILYLPAHINPFMFRDVLPGSVISLLGDDYQKVITTDFDGDGRQELLFYNDKNLLLAKFSSLYRVDVVANFSPILHTHLEEEIRSLNVGDLNSDGLPDLLVSYVYECRRDLRSVKYLSFLNKGGFRIEETPIHALEYNLLRDRRSRQFTLDFDLDGNLDLVFVGDERGSNNCEYGSGFVTVLYNLISVYLGDGNGGFTRTTGHIIEGEKEFFTEDVSPQNSIENKEHYIIPGRFLSTPSVNFFIMKKDNPTVNYIHESYTEPKFKLTKIEDGFGRKHELTYQPLSKKEIYDKSTAQTPTGSRQFNINSPLYVVSNITTDDGKGDVIATSYRYKNLVLDKERGVLGFRQTTSINHTTNTIAEDNYILDYRYPSPLLKESKTWTNETLVSKQINDYELKDYGGVYDTRLISSTDFSYAPETGNLLNRVQTQTLQDDFGNVTSVYSEYIDGRKDTLINTFSEQPAWKWLGRLEHSKRILNRGSERVVKEAAFEYDQETGLLVKEIVEPSIDKYRKIKKYKRDLYGNITEERVSAWAGGLYDRQSLIHRSFDDKGRFIVAESNTLGHEITYENDPLSGKTLRSTDANGIVKTYSHDGLFRPTRIEGSDGNWMDMEYLDGNGKVHGAKVAYRVRTSQSNGKIATTYFDVLDRKLRTETSTALNKVLVKDILYDKRGLIVEESLPYFKGASPLWNRRTYDDFGRPVRESFADGRESSIEYDGLRTSIINERGFQSSQTVDIHGAVQSATDAHGQRLVRISDIQNKLLTLSDGDLEYVQYERDLNGKLIGKTDSASGEHTSEYNAFGEAIKLASPNGTTRLLYDQLGRPILEILEDTEGVQDSIFYEYDSEYVGKISSIRKSSNGHQVHYRYDYRGLLIEQQEAIDGTTYTTQYVYNALGERTEIVYPSGLKVQNHYDQGMLVEVQMGDLVLYQLKDFNVFGKPTYEVSPANGTTTFKRYDLVRGMLTHTETINAQGEVINSLDFSYNEVGSLVRQTNNVQMTQESYEYDALEQLLSVSGTEGDLQMAYNKDGSLSYKSDVGKYHWSDGKLIGLEMEDDCPPASLNADFYYTSFNKVRRIDRDETQLYLSYGYHKQRIKHQLFQNGEWAKTRLYLGLESLDMLPEGKKERRSYISNGRELIAIFNQVTNGQDTTTTLSFIYKNHLGSTVAIADINGEVVERIDYDAWGKRRNTDGLTTTSKITDRGFTQHEHYDLLSLIDMNGRVYDPDLGLFLSPDILYQFTDKLHLLNRFSYVGNNPLSRVDPSGYIFKWLGKQIKKNWKGWLTTAVTIGVAIAAAPLGPVIAGGLAGAAGGLTGSLLNGKSLSSTIQNTVKGFYIGMLSGGAANMVGNLTMAQNSLLGKLAIKTIGHGFVQGGVSKVQGGKFWSGAASGAFTGLVSPFSKNLFKGNLTARRITAMIVGGTASKLSGGNFSNGAVAGAFIQLFNDERHENSVGKAMKIYAKTKAYSLSATDALLEFAVDDVTRALTQKGMRIAGAIFEWGPVAYDFATGNHYDGAVGALAGIGGFVVGASLSIVAAPEILIIGAGVGVGIGIEQLFKNFDPNRK